MHHCTQKSSLQSSQLNTVYAARTVISAADATSRANHIALTCEASSRDLRTAAERYRGLTVPLTARPTSSSSSPHPQHQRWVDADDDHSHPLFVVELICKRRKAKETLLSFSSSQSSMKSSPGKTAACATCTSPPALPAWSLVPPLSSRGSTVCFSCSRTRRGSTASAASHDSIYCYGSRPQSGEDCRVEHTEQNEGPLRSCSRRPLTRQRCPTKALDLFSNDADSTRSQSWSSMDTNMDCLLMTDDEIRDMEAFSRRPARDVPIVVSDWLDLRGDWEVVILSDPDNTQ